MSIFANMTTNGLEEQKDSLGGYSPLETDIYEATIKALYAQTAKSGAMSLNLIADINGREYRETVYITSKDGVNYYVNKAGKKAPLPGFITMNDLCLCAVGRELSELETETKVIKLYNREAKTEMPTEVPMVVDLIGAKVALGIFKEKVNKQVLEGNTYVDSEETREQNVINKVFHLETHKTVNEAKNDLEAEFWDKWLAKHQGKEIDRTKKGVKSNAPKASAPAPKKSLFAK